MTNTVKRSGMRKRLYWWIEREDKAALGPKILELLLITLILLNVVAVISETVDDLYARWKPFFEVFEVISLTVFTLEYLARLWIVPENPEFKSRLRWVFTPQAMVDLLAVLPALLVYFIPIDLRILRIFRMLRLLKLTRYSPALSMLVVVFEEEAGAFFAGFFILGLMLIFAASGVWLAEHQIQPEVFGSIPAAMWWAVATLTTVGYGDVVPMTVAGKLFGALIMVIGIGIAALPAGIIASGLNDQLQQRRASLRREFRIALEDGELCEEDRAEIDALRKNLGLSRNAAEMILDDVLYKRRSFMGDCEHCGKPVQASHHAKGEL